MRLQPRVLSMGIGAGAMYLLDPEQGKRRRALLRDRVVHLRTATATAAGKAARDLRNRTRGITHEVAARLHRESVDDVVLHDRVRARLGHAMSHPAAIEVACDDGVCTLRGAVLAGERDRLLAMVSKVRGVQEVVDDLEAHATADVPALQGEGRTGDALRRHPTPAGRALLGIAGGALLLAGGVLAARSRRRRNRLPRPSASERWARRGPGSVQPRATVSPGDGSLMSEGGEPLVLDRPGSELTPH